MGKTAGCPTCSLLTGRSPRPPRAFHLLSCFMVVRFEVPRTSWERPGRDPGNPRPSASWPTSWRWGTRWRRWRRWLSWRGRTWGRPRHTRSPGMTRQPGREAFNQVRRFCFFCPPQRTSCLPGGRGPTRWCGRWGQPPMRSTFLGGENPGKPSMSIF